MERRKNGRKNNGRKPTGRTAAGEGGEEALLLGGNSADSKGKEGRGSRDFRAGTAKVFCGGENGGSKGACIADGGGKHAGEENDCSDFYGRDFSGENGVARSGRKAENDFYAGSLLQEAPFAEQEKRKTIPIVAETGLAKKAAAAEEAEELPQEAPKKEREQAKGAEIDIERLMREMTKRLWEEREASGRRLRR